MDWYHQLTEKVLLPLGDKVMGSSFIHQLKELRAQINLDEAALRQLQDQKLQAILQYASANAIYYKNLYITPEKNPVHWLKKFPILDKRTLRNQQEHLLTMPIEKLIRNASSGSTGFQSVVYWSKKEQSIHRATQILWWEWAGYRLGDPVLQTGINPKRTFIKATKDRLLRTYYLQAFSHSKTEAIEALKWASQQQSPVLAGYASSLYVLAKYALESGIQVPFKTAITWGDKLFDHYRKAIETAFSTQVFETYGSAEGLMMAARKDIDYLYLMTPNIYLEIVDDNGQEVADGQLGHVLVTSLHAYAMPLIRYRIGDMAVKLPEAQYPSNKELHLPVVQKVIGRDTDLVKTRSGKYMVVHSFTGIFEHIPEIEQFCVIQENLDGITIQYIPGAKFQAGVLNEIKQKIISHLNENFNIHFQQVINIKPTASGKPQIIQSSLGLEQISL